MSMDQESRGSISYTDYYSNEDGQIRRVERPPETFDDEEDHTLTLKQSEEQKKQDVKFIFDAKEATLSPKPDKSFKQIGR